MYRIFILSLLAIVFSTFALEPSPVILRATEIGGDSITIEWSPIEGAVSYKVFYDETNLINPKVPEPILESPSTDKTTLEIQKMMDGTPYYLVVHGFDEIGTKVGETLPLHASTLRIPLFTLKESKVIDDQNISLTFSHPIDLKKTTIEIVNTETKKPRTVKNITLSTDDLRVVQIQLEGKLAPDMSHDIVLKKVTNTSGTEMSPESKKTSTIMYSTLPEVDESRGDTQDVSMLPAEETQEGEIAQDDDMPTSPDAALENLEQKMEDLDIERVEASIPLEAEEPAKTPVIIDQLPQTGTPHFLLLGIALLLGAGLAYKRKTIL